MIIIIFFIAVVLTVQKMKNNFCQADNMVLVVAEQNDNY